MPNNVRVGVQTTGVAKASSELDRLRDKFDKLQKQGAKGILAGVAAGATVAGINLIQSAIGGLSDAFADATQAALAEEVSIQKLGTALKANIPAWDGNTAAIEKTLKARMALGFSDDEQRDSLAKLVVATHDANKALDIQRTAMDLARLKSISLAEASDALIKVEGGQFRMLKSLGIELKKGATQTEALAAVQAAAAGQAADYAETNSGKLLVSQVKVDEAMERFGAKTLPLVVAGTEAAADAASGLATVLDFLDEGVADTVDGQREQVQGAIDLAGALRVLFPIYGGLADATQDQLDASIAAAEGSSDAVEKMRGSMGDDLFKAEGALDDVGDAATDMAKKGRKATKTMSQVVDDMVDDMVSDAHRANDEFFDPMIDAYDLMAKNAEIAALERKVASGTATAAEKADLLSLKQDRNDYLIDLAAAGKTTTKAYKTGVAELKKEIANASGPTKAYLQGILDRIIKIEAAGKSIPINFQVHGAGAIMGALAGLNGLPGRASGGPTQANKAYVVGENGPELFVSDQSGKVIPNGGRLGVGGSGSMTLNLTVNASPGMTPAAARDFGDQLGPVIVKWMQGQGILPRRGSPQA